MRAIFKKELGDLMRWIPLGMIACVVMLWRELPSNSQEALEVDSELATAAALVAATLAFGLGLLQSVFDARSDARGYLMHRPLSAASIYWAKTAAGFAAYSLTMLPGMLIAAIYLAAKGPEQLPTSAWQVAPVVWLSVVAFAFHPTAVWMIYRQAKWLGTKALPAVFVCGGLLLCWLIVAQTPLSNSFAVVSLLASLGITLLVLTLFAARHAFVAESLLAETPMTTAGWPRPSQWPGIIGITLSATILFGTVATIAVTSTVEAFSDSSGDYTTYNLRMSKDGEFYEQSRTVENQQWDAPTIKVRPVDSDSEFQTVDNNWPAADAATFVDVSSFGSHPLRPYRLLANVTTDRVPFRQVTLVQHADKLLVYGKSLIAVVTPEGVFDSFDDATGAFKDQLFYVPLLWNTQPYYSQFDGNQLFVDGNAAVYQFNRDDLSVTKLLESQVDEITLLLSSSANRPPTLWTRSGNQVSEHQLETRNPKNDVPVAPAPDLKGHHTVELPRIEVTATETYELVSKAARAQGSLLVVASTADGRLAAIRSIYGSSDTFRVEYQFLEVDSQNDSPQTAAMPMPLSRGPVDWFVAFTLPPLLTGTIVFARANTTPGSSNAVPRIALVMAHSMIALLVTVWLSRRFDLSKKRCFSWLAGAILTGFGAPLGMLAIYRRPRREICRKCGEKSRVDLETCQHCGESWATPELEGIEILDLDTTSSMDAKAAVSMA